MARASTADPANIPLIQCKECRWARVVHRVSKQEWSFGQAFCCCLFYKVSGSVKMKFLFLLDSKLILGIFLQDGTGCPFWKWEKEYLEVVLGKNTVGVQAGSSNAGTTMVKSPDLKMNTDGGARNNGWVKREAVSTEMVKEVFMVTKVIFVVCVALLFVLILVLLVLLVK
jgi:hypothetical protein